MLVLTICLCAIFANSMTKPLSRDENMYCTAAALMSQGKTIYKDFAYPSQLPYHPLICSAFYKILNTTNYLLVARLFSSVCDILIIICIFNIYRQLLDDYKITSAISAASAVVLYTFNPMVDYAAGYAWNHDLVILCIVLSFWLFISIDFRSVSGYISIFFIAALLTIATLSRITTAIILLIFFLFILFAPADSLKQRLKTICPFIISMLLFSIWPIYIISKAPQAFALNLFKIPALYAHWLAEQSLIFKKTALTLFCFTMPGYLVLLISASLLFFAMLKLRKHLTKEDKRNFALISSITAALVIIIYIPPTIWRQYFAPPVAFIIIASAYPLLYLRKHLTDTKYSKIAVTIFTASAAIAIITNSFALQKILILSDYNLWTPIKVNRISKKIADVTPSPKTALTLAPLYAIQGRCLIYPELAAGSITYRIADKLSAEQRKLTTTAGPAQMDLLTKLAPPSVVILNVEPLAALEKTLLPYIQNDFKTLVFEDQGPVIHYRP